MDVRVEIHLSEGSAAHLPFLVPVNARKAKDTEVAYRALLRFLEKCDITEMDSLSIAVVPDLVETPR